MSADPATPEKDANLSALGRELLDTAGSKPSFGPWVPPTAEELHKLLPEYEIVKMLGRGGMGAVYMGKQISLDRPVAIKILSTALEDADPSFAERFKNEARAMGKLNFAGIVSVYDFGEAQVWREDGVGRFVPEAPSDDRRAGDSPPHQGPHHPGLLYIVMEYVEGTDVAKMIAKQGRLHTDHAMAITAHVCYALGIAEDIVRGVTVVQRDELAQPGELRARKVAHVGEVFAVTDHGAEGDEQHFGQGVAHAPDNARVGQGGKELFEPQDVLKVRLVLGSRGCGSVDESRFHPHSHQ